MISYQIDGHKLLSKPEKEEVYYKNGHQLTKSKFNPIWLTELNIEPKIIFDIGCFDLGDTLRLKEKFPQCQFFSFEACPERFKICEKYGKIYNIQVYHFAITNKIGFIDFYPSYNHWDKKSGAQGSIYKHTANYSRKFTHIEQQDLIVVPTITIGEFCQQYNTQNIDLLHVDVEGAELNVINGLDNIEPKLIYVETINNNLWHNAPTIAQLHEKMYSLNYNLLLDLGSDRLYSKNI